ncbi:unnamed protein product, partial [Ectocarpus sp. 12 AP-2014]
ATATATLLHLFLCTTATRSWCIRPVTTRRQHQRGNDRSRQNEGGRAERQVQRTRYTRSRLVSTVRERMTGRGRSSRVRRKPQTVYDTVPLASEEQLSQQSEDEGRNRTAGGGRRPNKKQKTAAGTRGAKTTAAAKGRGRGGARKSHGGGGSSSDNGRALEKEQEE